MESKLKEFEQSLQKLKDCTYSEAAQRREFELSLRKVQADLRGASLREQVMMQPLAQRRSSQKPYFKTAAHCHFHVVLRA